MSAHDATTAPLRADAARNRELVLEAAGRLLREQGLDMTMQEVADAAGVGVGTIFRRFESKEELVAALIERRLLKLLAILERGIDQLEVDPWDAFAGAFTESVDLHVRDRGFTEAVGCDVGLHPRHEQLRAKSMNALRTLVDGAIEAGMVRTDLVAEDVTDLACLVARSSAMPSSRIEAESWRRTCSVVLDGMRPHGALSRLAPARPSYESIVDSIASS